MKLAALVVLCLRVVACEPSGNLPSGTLQEEARSGEAVARETDPHPVIPDSIAAAVERAARAFLRAAPQAAGLSVGVVAGDAIHTYHFGSLVPGGDVRPDDHTLYGIASVTKTFTGTILARAADEGRLKLDDDVRDYLAGTFPNLEYEGHPIALSHLVNHTSGLPNTLPDRAEMYPDFPAYQGDVVAWMDHVTAVLDAYSREDFLADLHTITLDTLPGTRFRYSNAGAQLAGHVLERVYGRPFETLVDSFISQPLGMVDTRITLDADEAMRLATGFDEAGRAMPPVPAAFGAAGALKSTIADLSRYARWHLAEDDPSVRRTHTPPASAGGATWTGYAVGLNWQMLRSGDIRRVWQDGNVPGYSSRVVLYPDLKIAVVVLANELDRSIPEHIDRLADAILESMDQRTFSLMEGLSDANP